MKSRNDDKITTFNRQPNYCFSPRRYIPRIFHKISSRPFFFLFFSLSLSLSLSLSVSVSVSISVSLFLSSWTRQEHYEWRWQGCILIRKPIKPIGARTRVKRSFRRIHRPYRGWAPASFIFVARCSTFYCEDERV